MDNVKITTAGRLWETIRGLQAGLPLVRRREAAAGSQAEPLSGPVRKHGKNLLRGAGDQAAGRSSQPGQKQHRTSDARRPFPLPWPPSHPTLALGIAWAVPESLRWSFSEDRGTEGEERASGMA